MEPGETVEEVEEVPQSSVVSASVEEVEFPNTPPPSTAQVELSSVPTKRKSSY